MHSLLKLEEKLTFQTLYIIIGKQLCYVSIVTKTTGSIFCDLNEITDVILVVINQVYEASDRLA